MSRWVCLFVLMSAVSIPAAAVADRKAKPAKRAKPKPAPEPEEAPVEEPPAEEAKAPEPAPEPEPEPEAKPEPEPEKKPPAPAPAAEDGVRLLPRAKQLVISGATLNVNLSAEAVAKPVTLAPSLWYGITDKLAIGVTHDGGSLPLTPRPAGIRVVTTEILPGISDTEISGSGVCVTGKDANCSKVYDNVGLDGAIGLATGKLTLAAHVGLDMVSLSETTLALRVGAVGRYALGGKVALTFDPRVQIGLTDRDFNGEALDVPLWVWFAATPKLGVYLHTGIAGPFEGFGDSFAIPVGLGVTAAASAHLSFGLDFLFPNLAGKNSTADGRVLGVRIAYAL